MQTDREKLLNVLAGYNSQWEAAHARYLQRRLSEDHESMLIARQMIDFINRKLDAMDAPEILAAE